jgi:transcriptional regulator with XRE-family HTH domain
MTNLIDFSQWLKNEMKIRGWRQADLARATGIDSSVFSRILNLEREPSPDTCRAIAKALVLPPEVVFRKAGFLPEKPYEPPEQSPDILEMIRLYNDLEDADQHEVLAIIRTIVKEKKARYDAAKKGTPATQS